MDNILSSHAVSISELKKNPSALLRESEGEAIAILNHNKPTAYLVAADTYEEMLDALEDIELGCIIEARKSEKKSAKTVSINDL